MPDSPTGFANRLAAYITDPKRVVALTNREYGKAPTIERVGLFIARHQERTARFKRTPFLDAFDELNDNGEHYAPKPILSKSDKDKLRRVKPPKAVDIQVADKALWPKWYTPASRLPAEMVLLRIGQAFGIKVSDIKGKQRNQYMVGSRAVFVRLMRDRGLSFPIIGRLLGGRDHSTIFHSLDHYEKYANANPTVEKTYQELRRYNG